jgi:hypothetical protein
MKYGGVRTRFSSYADLPCSRVRAALVRALPRVSVSDGRLLFAVQG